jgi:hypothetical protein
MRDLLEFLSRHCDEERAKEEAEAELECQHRQALYDALRNP